jgi:DNA-binding PadR family transcriptional regulator
MVLSSAMRLSFTCTIRFPPISLTTVTSLSTTKHCKDGLVEKSIYSQPGSRASDQEVYRLTSKGRDFCRRELSITRLYGAQNPAHDLVLADRYFSLSESERETWQTETQSREIINAHIRQLREQGEEEHALELWDKLQDGRLSMPDAVYTRSDGISVAFEVVTNNYGQSELEAKEQAAEALGAEIEIQNPRPLLEHGRP